MTQSLKSAPTPKLCSIKSEIMKSLMQNGKSNASKCKAVSLVSLPLSKGEKLIKRRKSLNQT